MNYILNKELKEVSLKLCESINNYNTNLKEKDKSFKVLFEVKEQFIQLLRTFVKEEWVEKVNEENIELVDKEFTTINLEERRADVVYKIKLKRQEIYFFLLEIQSSVDKMMPFRLYEYMLELYRKYKGKNKLPLVIPCVLYTGNEKWNVGNLKSLFNVRKEVERYIPNFDYILLDVNNYTDEELIKTSNLISSVFFLSKSKTEMEVVKRIDKLLKMMKMLTENEQKSLARWTKTMFIKSDEVQEYLYVNSIYKEDDEDMALADLIPGAIEIWKKQGWEQGREEGREEGESLGYLKGLRDGKEEGVLKTKISSLKRILTKKLNQNPPKEVIVKLENLTIEELESIEDRIFEIESWEEI